MNHQPSREDYHQLKMQIAREQNVFDLSVINPDLVPAQEVTDKLLEACLQSSVSAYTSGSGLPQLKSAFANRYRKSFDVDISEQSVCIERGTQSSLQSVFFALGGSKDLSEVILPLPYYTLHLEAITKARFKPQFYQLGNDLSDTIQNIKEIAVASSKAKFLILNFPNNPTGWVADSEFYDQVLVLAEQYEFCLLYTSPSPRDKRQSRMPSSA